MGIIDWTECSDKKLIKEAKADEFLIASLIKSSVKKMESCQRLGLDETTAASKISLAYDSLREMLEALALKQGFKVYNHECFCAFLKTVLKEYLLAEDFDRFRKIRNSVNYYGKDIEVKEAKAVVAGIGKLRKEIESKYLK